MGSVAVAISLVAADLSAITYMGLPAWAFEHDLGLIWAQSTYLLVAPIVMYVFLPFYMKFRFYTGYEYLERRFDLKTRLVVSGLFLLMRGSHVAIAIYAPSIILSLLTGLPLYVSVLIMGAFTTAYTTLGGMRAVIWTDVMQFSILMSGMIAVSWLSIARIPGGIRAISTIAGQAGHLGLFNFSLDPHQITAFWPSILGGSAIALSTLGTDQAYLQRYFSTRSLREGRLSILMDACMIVPVSLILLLLGPSLYTFYHFYPEHLKGLPSADALLPFFVVHELSGVISGVIIASIFASSMAVMSAGLNSLTTATTVDFYKRWLRPNLDESHYVLVGRWGTVAWGVATTVAALFANRLGPLVNAFTRIMGLLGGPVLAIFLLGMLTRRAKATSSVIGGGVSLIFVIWVAGVSNISFFYHALIGAVTTFVIGYLLSLFGAKPKRSQLDGLVRGMEGSMGSVPKAVGK